MAYFKRGVLWRSIARAPFARQLSSVSYNCHIIVTVSSICGSVGVSRCVPSSQLPYIESDNIKREIDRLSESVIGRVVF